MICSVTVLGDSSNAGLANVGKRIVEYLEGGRLVVRGPGVADDAPPAADQTVAYYADSPEIRPGRWLLGNTGEVDPDELATLLAGFDPSSGEPLISAKGSNRRAQRQRLATISEAMLDKDSYSTSEAAFELGVSKSYLTTLLRKAEREGDEAATGISRTEAGEWRITRDALVHLSMKRRPARIVVGYDLTFSAPKSVSVLWAGSPEEVRREVIAAIDESVRAGIDYLQRHAIFVRRVIGHEKAEGLIAADYLHTTSRALDPQLHHHVLLLNYGLDSTARSRALDARLLFNHAKTAGYLAAAELRHQLSTRLGVRFEEVVNGVAEIAGIPTAVLKEMSRRSREIASATEELGYASAKARQVAAWSTRADKDAAVDARQLFQDWETRLNAAGFGAARRTAVLARQVTSPMSGDEVERLLSRAARLDGVTYHEAAFDRRDVVQLLAERSGHRLEATRIDELADMFLARKDVVALHARAGLLQTGQPRLSALPGLAEYSTKPMIALEREALRAYERGRMAQAGIVSSPVVAQVLARSEFAHLSDEQRTFAAALTTSGLRVQAAVGAAGTGKTTALRAAVTAWQEAGYRVLGCAVGGIQSDVLAEQAGVEARTVASLLMSAHNGSGLRRELDDRMVVLVDEASLVSTQDFVQLARIVENSGAAIRLVGDPHQHSAVRAGGLFRHIVENHPEDVPQLTHVFRQSAPAMRDVSRAMERFRKGEYAQAIAQLARGGRIVSADLADEAYDLMVAAWYEQRLREGAAAMASPMIAERHRDRRALNERARAWLIDDGTISGPELVVGGVSYRKGDDVIARVTDRSMRSGGGRFVRNGSRGTIEAIGVDSMTVVFEGCGVVEIPTEYLHRKVRRSVGEALQHAYALTSHAVQGSTHDKAIALLTDCSRPEGAYVAVTRGRADVSTVASIAVYDLETLSTQVRSDQNSVRQIVGSLERSEAETVVTTRARIDREVVRQVGPSPLKWT
jgi:conjugative relaxase-like TrwC/TraI family protein